MWKNYSSVYWLKEKLRNLTNFLFSECVCTFHMYQTGSYDFRRKKKVTYYIIIFFSCKKKLLIGKISELTELLWLRVESIIFIFSSNILCFCKFLFRNGKFKEYRKKFSYILKFITKEDLSWSILISSRELNGTTKNLY